MSLFKKKQLLHKNEFLKEKYGTGKLVEVYKKLGEDISLEDAYKDVCSGDLVEIENEWREKVVSVL